MYNNSYMKMGKNSRIAHLLFNGAMIPALKQEHEYVTTLRKIAEIGITNASSHFSIFGPSYSDLVFKMNLKSSYDLGFELAVVWFEGSWPLSEEFEEELLKVYDDTWTDSGWLAAGHLLSRRPATDLPTFDPQCIVINLKEWYAVRTATDYENNYTYTISEDHIHDDYTPMWISPGNDYHLKDKERGEGCLDYFIPLALSRNLTVHNLPWNVRSEKHCCYPEDDIEFTKDWLLNKDFSNLTRREIMLMRDDISEDKEELLGYKHMDKVVLYITNTESVPKRERHTYDHNIMTCPCSGLHQFTHMINAKDTLERVIWTDFSDAGLWWIQHLIENWDGNNFDAFYQNHKEQIQEKFNIDEETTVYDIALVEQFFEDVADSWEDDWNFIRGLNHQFEKIDIVNDYQRLIDEIGTGNKVFMQVSNIWQYEINYINTKHCDAQKAFIDIVTTVLNNNEDLYVTGDTPSGTYYEYQNMKEIASIF